MKKVQIMLVVTMVTACATTCAQNKLVDSLKSALAVSTEENRYDILWGLAWELYDVENKEALRFAQEAYPLALKTGDSLKIVKSSRLLGQLLRRGNKVDESIKLLTQILPVSARNGFDSETQIVLNALALSHTHRGEYSKAIDYHFQTLALREKQGDKVRMSISYHNIGLIFYKLGSMELALDYYFKSLKAREESSYMFEVEYLFINIGLSYVYLKDYKNAIRYFNQGLETCQRECDQTLLMYAEFGIGQNYFFQDQFSLASAHFRKSLEFAEIENNQELQMDDLSRLAAIAIKEGDLVVAADYLKRVEKLSEKDQFRQPLVDVYKLSAIVAKHAEDYEKAYFYQMKHGELLDSVYVFETNKNIMKVQIEYEQKENLARLESQEKIMVLQSESLRIQQTLNVMIGITTALSFGLAAILFRSNRHRRKINQVLDLRVRERTAELEESRDLLQHSHDRQEIVLGRVISELNSAFRTIKGLAAIASNELPVGKMRYFRELETTVEHLTMSIENLICQGDFGSNKKRPVSPESEESF